ncbi:MAG: hypothetical protein HY903_11360 [Deltaproteobacteria bacterium]|nr:hypothetical protein [Deltaproteobacteria bacterium]
MQVGRSRSGSTSSISTSSPRHRALSLATAAGLGMLAAACTPAGDDVGLETATTAAASSAETLVCDRPLIESPAAKPVDPCRSGTTVLGPNTVVRTTGHPNQAEWPFTTAVATAACVIVENGSVCTGGEGDDHGQGNDSGQNGNDNGSSNGSQGDQGAGNDNAHGNSGGNGNGQGEGGGNGHGNSNKSGKNDHENNGHQGGHGHGAECEAGERVTSGWVAVDSRRVIGPNRYNRQVAHIEQRIALAAGEHVLKAGVAGAPGSAMAVSLKTGGTSGQSGLVRGEHLELFNLFAEPGTFSPARVSTTLSAEGTVLRLGGDEHHTFIVRWAFEIRSIATCVLVRTLAGEWSVAAPGTFTPSATWDGKDGAGAAVPDGAYTHRLVARLVKVGPSGRPDDDDDSAGDGDGLLVTAQQQLMLDSTAPAIAVVLPADGDALNTQLVDVDIPWSDPVVNGFASGLDLLSGQVSLDGMDVSGLLTLDATGARGTLDLSAQPDGAHAVVGTIADLVGNVGTATSSFVVDTVPPVVTWTLPSEATDAAAVPLAFDLADATSGLALSTLEITSNGMLITAAVQCTPAGLDGVLASTCTGAYALEEGEWLLTAALLDSAGNLGSAVRQVVVDRSPPTIILDPDLTGVVTGADSVAVMGRVIDLLDADLWVNGQPVPVVEGSFSTQVSLAAGPNTITLLATDELGHTAGRSVLVVRDNKAPVIDALTLNAVAAACASQPPPDGQAIAVTYTMSPNLHAEYHDAGAGVNSSEIRLTVDGLELACATRSTDPAPLSIALTCATDLSGGVHHIKLSIPDATGMSVRECWLTVDVKAHRVPAPENGPFSGVVVEVPDAYLASVPGIVFSAPDNAPNLGDQLPGVAAIVVGPAVDISGQLALAVGDTIRVTLPFRPEHLTTALGDDIPQEEVRAHYYEPGAHTWVREEAGQWIVDTTTSTVTYHTTHLSLRASTATTRRPVASLSAGLVVDNGTPAPGDQRLLLLDILNMGLMPLPVGASKLFTAPFDVAGAFSPTAIAKAKPKLTESFIKAVKPRPTGGAAVLYRSVWAVPAGQLADLPVNATIDEVAVVSGAGAVEGRVHIQAPDSLTWVCRRTTTSPPKAMSSCPPGWITESGVVQRALQDVEFSPDGRVLYMISDASWADRLSQGDGIYARDVSAIAMTTPPLKSLPDSPLVVGESAALTTSSLWGNDAIFVVGSGPRGWVMDNGPLNLSASTPAELASRLASLGKRTLAAFGPYGGYEFTSLDDLRAAFQDYPPTGGCIDTMLEDGFVSWQPVSAPLNVVLRSDLRAWAAACVPDALPPGSDPLQVSMLPLGDIPASARTLVLMRAGLAARSPAHRDLVSNMVESGQVLVLTRTPAGAIQRVGTLAVEEEGGGGRPPTEIAAGLSDPSSSILVDHIGGVWVRQTALSAPRTTVAGSVDPERPVLLGAVTSSSRVSRIWLDTTKSIHDAVRAPRSLRGRDLPAFADDKVDVPGTGSFGRSSLGPASLASGDAVGALVVAPNKHGKRSRGHHHGSRNWP